jgi:LEA14-like dessication related protein
MTVLYRFVALMTLLVLTGCAGWQRGYETPQVNITSFALAPDSTGLAPRFNIGVQVINPNRNALPLRGMSYGVEIEGHRILSGATADLPRVAGYSSADIVIQASPDLFGGMRLLSDLMAGQRQGLNYTFRAKLDVGRVMPMINVVESGQFNMPAAGQR